jgi:hypothetical protein
VHHGSPVMAEGIDEDDDEDGAGGGEGSA